jgi:putative phosphoribosyl transferase
MTSRADRKRRFQDRRAAGRFLAERLRKYGGRNDGMVLGLPRGGVPVAFEVARALGLPMDVFIVRKLGVPGFEELAMGAIASGGVRVLNHSVLDQLPHPDEALAMVTEQETRELARREAEYRAGKPPLELRDRIIILVDDGLATGATMRAAVQALRQAKVSRCIVGVPVAAPETCAEFREDVDEIVCAITPEDFHAVGQYYMDFLPTSDAEVRALLAARSGTIK